MELSRIYGNVELIFTQEDFWKYQPGGFHPIHLGDKFKGGRYTIHHKLGYGGSSTVWLAHDGQREGWVSIKILMADCEKPSREINNLRTLAAHSQGRPGSEYIVSLIDDFVHHGPNGSHQCLVFELLGPSPISVIRDYHEDPDIFDPELLVKMSKQLLQGIAFIHDVGYVHGDISARNVAFTSSKFWNLPKKDLFEILGEPRTRELARKDGEPLGQHVPKQLVEAAGWDLWAEEEDEDLRIIDLGEAFPKEEKHREPAQPRDLRAPETIFTKEFDSGVDLWCAGIMIYFFIFGSLPFWTLGKTVHLVKQMIGFVEDMPVDWRPQWDEMQKDTKVAPKQHDPQSKSRLEERFDEKVPDEDLKLFLPVIQGLMRFLPEERISASEALGLVEEIAERIDKRYY